jgi:hypothetical protein
MAANTWRVKALYGVPELAAMIEVSPKTMRRLLRTAGVLMIRSGRRLLVPLSEIEGKLGVLRQSVERREMWREQLERVR